MEGLVVKTRGVPEAASLPDRRAPMTLLYLTPGCFDKGGISRYSRYQIASARSILGVENVCVHSLASRDDAGFEEYFRADFAAGGLATLNKLHLLARSTLQTLRMRPSLVLAAHVNLSGVAHVLARLAGARSILNIYGREVWSGFRPDARWGLTSTDHVIADCHFTADYVEARALRKRGSTTVIWDCVDVKKFCPGEPNPRVLAKYRIPDPATSINLLTLGRMTTDVAYKGYARLLEVFARANQFVPSLSLVYAGRGSLTHALAARARALGIASRVHFAGPVDDQDLPDVYRSAHMFSLVGDRGVGRGEGLPLTPIEAAACGVPIMVGDQDGSTEAIVEDRIGFRLHPHDTEAHVERVVELARSPQRRAEMGIRAAEAAHRHFSFEEFHRKHEELLNPWMATRP